MADTTFGVKVAPEFREKIDDLIQKSDFKTTKEWFEFLVGTYELQILKESTGAKNYVGDIEAIETLTSRIVIILKSLVEKATDSYQSSQEEFSSYKSQSEKDINATNERIRLLQEELSSKQKEFEKTLEDQKEIRKQVGQLEELTHSRKQLIETKDTEIAELKSQLYELSQGNSFAKLKEDNQGLQNELLQLRNEMKLKELDYTNQLAQERVRSETNKEYIKMLKKQVSDYQFVLTEKRGPGRPKNEDSDPTTEMRDQAVQLDFFEQTDIPDDQQES